MSTKIYRNTSKATLSVLGVGEIAVGEQVSITTEHQPVVILENYPGLVDVTDEPSEDVSPSEGDTTNGEDI